MFQRSRLAAWASVPCAILRQLFRRDDSDMIPVQIRRFRAEQPKIPPTHWEGGIILVAGAHTTRNLLNGSDGQLAVVAGARSIRNLRGEPHGKVPSNFESQLKMLSEILPEIWSIFSTNGLTYLTRTSSA